MATAAASSNAVILQTSDDEQFTVDKKVAERSAMIKSMLEGESDAFGNPSFRLLWNCMSLALLLVLLGGDRTRSFGKSNHLRTDAFSSFHQIPSRLHISHTTLYNIGFSVSGRWIRVE
jgi:hypothetical protein